MKNILIILLVCSIAFTCGANKKELSKVEGSVSKETTSSNESASKKVDAKDKADTTIKTDLNGDGTNEKIELLITKIKDGKFDVIKGFNLSINDKAVEKKFDTENFPGFIELILTDINKGDKMKEILVSCDYDPSGIIFLVYTFDGSNIIFIDSLETNYPENNYTEFFPGNGKAVTNEWMGFWKRFDNYTYDSQKFKFTNDNTTGLYEVKFGDKIKNDFAVTKSIKLRKERDDKSEITATLNKGNKIKIIKADIKAKCTDNNDNEDLSLCHWYYIESKNGNGWVRLKDFKDNVEGLPWAG